MSTRSKIEWTGVTWSPVLGCQTVSEGCRNCYAMRLAWRHAHNPKIRDVYEGLTKKDRQGHVGWTGRVRCLSQRLMKPFEWTKPKLVFVNSMSDLFHRDIPDHFIADVYSVMLQATRHTFQVLTKRPERVVPWARGLLAHKYRHLVWPGPCGVSHLVHDDKGTLERRVVDEATFTPSKMRMSCVPGWEALQRAPNIWLGVSVENADHVDRIDTLRACPASVKFLSLEPLLGPLPELNLTGIDWVIVGDESGHGRRSADMAWVQDIKNQCVDQGVRFFFKQWHDPSTGKKISLPQLDGRQWNEMPVSMVRAAA